MKLISIIHRSAIINTIIKTFLHTLVISLVATFGFFTFFASSGMDINMLLPVVIMFIGILIPVFFLILLRSRLDSILHTRRICRRLKSDIISVEFQESFINIKYIDKKRNISYPYETFKSSSLDLYCSEYTVIGRNRDEQHVLALPTITLTFPDDTNITITTFPLEGVQSLSGNFEIDFNYIYKIIRFLLKTGDFTYSIDTPQGPITDEMPVQKYIPLSQPSSALDALLSKEILPDNFETPYITWPQRINQYINRTHSFPTYKRFCDKYQKPSFITASFLIFLVVLALIFLGFTTSNEPYQHNWTIIAYSAIILGTFYLDYRLLKDEIFDHQKPVLIWILPLIKLSFIPLCWWLLKINYYI